MFDFGHIKPDIIAKGNGVPLYKLLHHSILKYKYYKYFPIFLDFCTEFNYFAPNLPILDLFNLAS